MKFAVRFLALWLGGLSTLSKIVAPCSAAASDATNTHFARDIQPLLTKHCVECHGADEPKGKLRLDQATPVFDAAGLRSWQRVLERVESGQMPPKSQPRLSAEELSSLTTWLRDATRSAELSRRASEGRVVLRRLNRNEYQNTIRDLLGVEVDLREQLPTEGAADGFDNAAAALHTSSFLMEKYLEAADTALNYAISNRPQPPKQIAGKLPFKESHPIRSTQEDVYRFIDETVVCFCSSAWHNVSLSRFYPQEGGFYRFKITVSAYQSGGKPVTFRVTAGNTRLTGTSGLVGYYDAQPDKPQTIEFVRYMEPRTTVSILPYGLQSAQAVKAIGGAEKYEGPGLALHAAEAEGPLFDHWPPESHRRLFGDLPQKNFPAYNFRERVEVVSDQPLVDARQVLTRFVTRAYRRPVTDTDVQPFVKIVETKLADNYTFEQALRAALKGVLVAPEFLFLSEKPGKLDSAALANRLSYFLWSSMPDAALLELAANNKLLEPAILRAQVERLLQAPKARAFTENFVGQWLNLREIDATEPSHILYPEFDHLLKVSMIRETELFFDEVLKHDLSLTNFTSADFTLLNGRLAKHYGIAGPEGWEFRKVTLPPESKRGGVLTMASVLKVTANGTTTSPVLRGAWVLDRLLGVPAPPPPSDVPVIDPDIRGATTIREQLAKHRSTEACAVCHVKIDPPGFALESFDCIGGWRDEYRVTGSGRSVTVDGRRMAYHIGKPVDPSDVMEDGAKFADVVEFKRLLLRDKDQLARALASKLLTYATGAAPTAIDRPAIDVIVARIRDKNYGLRSLVHEIAGSELFQTKQYRRTTVGVLVFARRKTAIGRFDANTHHGDTEDTERKEADSKAHIRVVVLGEARTSRSFRPVLFSVFSVLSVVDF